MVLWLPVVAWILVEWLPVVVWLGGCWWLPGQVVARGCLWLVNCVPVVAGGCLWLPIGGTDQPWLSDTLRLGSGLGVSILGLLRKGVMQGHSGTYRERSWGGVVGKVLRALAADLFCKG